MIQAINTVPRTNHILQKQAVSLATAPTLDTVHFSGRTSNSPSALLKPSIKAVRKAVEEALPQISDAVQADRMKKCYAEFSQKPPLQFVDDVHGLFQDTFDWDADLKQIPELDQFREAIRQPLANLQVAILSLPALHQDKKLNNTHGKLLRAAGTGIEMVNTLGYARQQDSTEQLYDILRKNKQLTDQQKVLLGGWIKCLNIDPALRQSVLEHGLNTDPHSREALKPVQDILDEALDRHEKPLLQRTLNNLRAVMSFADLGSEKFARQLADAYHDVQVMSKALLERIAELPEGLKAFNERLEERKRWETGPDPSPQPEESALF
jgi:hypothetical protein